MKYSYHTRNTMQETIGSMIKESGETNRLVQELSPQIGKAAVLLIDALKNNKKIILAGNGGSAEMSAHIAAEFVGRYKIERKALPAIALTTDLAAITAIGNDYGFDAVFERQLEALGKEGDVFIALTTSGNSKNLIRAAQKAKELNIDVIGLLGKDGGKMKSISKLDIIVPSYNTPRIQEAHLMILHIICELVEKELFG